MSLTDEVLKGLIPLEYEMTEEDYLAFFELDEAGEIELERCNAVLKLRLIREAFNEEFVEDYERLDNIGRILAE